MDVLKTLVHRLDIVQKYLWVSSHFDIKRYVWKIDIAFSCLILWDNLFKNIENNLAKKDLT